MSNELLPYEMDWSRMPVALGSALRVPVDRWGVWGITPRPEKFSEYDRLSELAYKLEWENTTQQGLDDINRAANAVGLGEANAQLNEACAEPIIAYYLNHPLEILKTMDWDTKDEDIATFIEKYPLALDDQPETNPMLVTANEEIGERFWPEYGRTRTTDHPQFQILEGHRSVEDNVLVAERAGLTTGGNVVDDVTEENPKHLRPDSELHSVVCFQKGDN
jgi:hypothetical protein